MNKNNNIKLKAMNIREIHDIFTILKDNETIKYTNFEQQKDLNECKTYINNFLNHNKNESLQHGPFSIFLDDTLIGMCGIEQKNLELSLSEIWYILYKSYWNKGYGSEIVEMLIDIGRKNKNLKIIYAEAVEDNSASWKILEKKGFVRKEKILYGFKKAGGLHLLKYELLL